mmetsp:Transcript_56216/g.77467  ORF Transcript_56216/g.77467 Transcript_56216/m.77467 type:complete len:96 (-) Transcript_56216:109-396(-)|eukprot:CAMPEP_0176356294 /NCGR_PEP_ID=MMETSP0126-20121128/13913_1 /TAXON_ID=141414 ORGANISM="Strombidinopsis acuminatum, Strain SPMC142" /NCGR_SAMPLE_ID=MMETSP0126 /ASSEMBLY_ACC=CAM_ASM_000229 /LENGTH=95 /DNA_ID=CAMNT_0017709325 /DNA_START=196 /DNA_END=483 /DNA_ORIENTATION=-
MDFSTVCTKLIDEKYATFEDAFADIQLIWDNCKLYNLAGSDIYKLAERMEKTSRREILKFRAQNGIQQVNNSLSNKNKRGGNTNNQASNNAGADK